MERAVVAEPGERVTQRIGDGGLVADLELGLVLHEGGHGAPHHHGGDGQGSGRTGGDGDRGVLVQRQHDAVDDREREHAEHDAAEHAAGQNAGRGHRLHGGPIRWLHVTSWICLPPSGPVR